MSRQAIRATIPPDQLKSIVDNIGLPVSGINRAYTNTGGIGPQDGDIYITLTEKHRPTADYVRDPAPAAAAAVPRLDLRLPARRHHQPDPQLRRARADRPAGGRARTAPPTKPTPTSCSPGCSTSPASPTRGCSSPATIRSSASPSTARAPGQLGLTERDVTNTLATSLAGSFQTAPAFWLNPRNGVSYPIVAQAPQQDVNTLSRPREHPDHRRASPATCRSSAALATITREDSDAVVTHYAIQPSFDLYATTQGRDLGAVAADIEQADAPDCGRGAARARR